MSPPIIWHNLRVIGDAVEVKKLLEQIRPTKEEQEARSCSSVIDYERILPTPDYATTASAVGLLPSNLGWSKWLWYRFKASLSDSWQGGEYAFETRWQYKHWECVNTEDDMAEIASHQIGNDSIRFGTISGNGYKGISLLSEQFKHLELVLLTREYDADVILERHYKAGVSSTPVEHDSYKVSNFPILQLIHGSEMTPEWEDFELDENRPGYFRKKE